MLFKLDFANNIIVSYFFFLFFIIYSYLLTLEIFAQIFNPIAALVIPMGMPS